MNAQAQDAGLFPALTPESEEVASADPSFATACLSEASRMAAAANWELGQPVLTRSERWGTICRLDFTIRGREPGPLVNRIVCWRNADDGLEAMFAIGQTIPELKPPK